jgi:serine phosphatase RsbU (regulator of sigma subunit)
MNCEGVPPGVMGGARYGDTRVQIRPDDRLLFYTDGAVEIYNEDDELLRVDGLIAILKKLGYPTSGLQLAALEEELLRYSSAAWPKDDVTFMEIHFAPEAAKGA